MFSFTHNGANTNLSNTKRDFTLIERIEKLEEHSINKASTSKDAWLTTWAVEEGKIRVINPEIANKINKISDVIKGINWFVSDKSQDVMNVDLREALYKVIKTSPVGQEQSSIDTSLVRSVKSNPLGEKYALVVLGNSLVEGQDKLSDSEIKELLVIEAKPLGERNDAEIEIARKAEKSAKEYNDVVEAMNELNSEIAKILKNAPSLFRDGEYSPAPGVWNSLGYRQCTSKPWLDHEISTKFFSIHYSVAPALEDTLASLKARGTSVHFIVDNKVDSLGKTNVIQLVDTAYRAYSEGIGSFAEKSLLNPNFSSEVLENNLNAMAISIMFVGSSEKAYLDAQLKSAAVLMDELCNAGCISKSPFLVGYSDWKGNVTTTTKEGKTILAHGPGKYFPYEKFAQASTNPFFQGLEIKNNFGIFPDVAKLSAILLEKNIATKEGDKLKFADNSPLPDAGYEDLKPTLATLGYSIKNVKNAALTAKMHFIADIIAPGRTERADGDYE
jgi:N-acetyl-anhydromuramyl-L-alanine amidase AmpD